MITTFARDEDGATAIEYALLVSLIAVVILAALVSVGEQAGVLYQSIADAYPGASG